LKNFGKIYLHAEVEYFVNNQRTLEATLAGAHSLQILHGLA
jgi:hypothetical protein